MADEPLATLKLRAAAEIDRRAERLWQISLYIHSHPELAFQEVQASSLLRRELTQAGFDVREGIAGLPTAFRAQRRGAADSPAVAFQAEFDALPELGHACGHNLIAAAALGAGCALAALGDDLPGTAVVVGTPAEERGGGKVAMLAAGAWDGVDVSLYVHGHRGWGVMNRNMAMVAVQVRFRGTPANAAGGKPVEGEEHGGASALGAAVAFLNNFNTIRGHLPPQVFARFSLTEGGQPTDWVPLESVVHVHLRAPDHRRLAAALGRLETCARAAALATETDLDWRPDVLYQERRPNEPLRRTLLANMRALGLPDVEDEQAVLSSTDSGNVSQQVPLGGAHLKVVEPPVTVHSAEFARAAASPQGRVALVAGAKIMAWTALDVMAQPRLMDEIRRRFVHPQALPEGRPPGGTGRPGLGES